MFTCSPPDQVLHGMENRSSAPSLFLETAVAFLERTTHLFNSLLDLVGDREALPAPCYLRDVDATQERT